MVCLEGFWRKKLCPVLKNLHLSERIGEKCDKTRQEEEHSKKEYTHAHWEKPTLTTKHQCRRTAVSSPTTFNT
jgi:hypothetical protein